MLKTPIAAVLVLASAMGAFAFEDRSAPPLDAATVEVAAGNFAYRISGEFLRDGVPVDAPLQQLVFGRSVAIMQRQVSAADYARCVADNACKATSNTQRSAALPVVGVDWNDAVAYAAWLSRKTGYHFRLPTDAEWAYVAGDRFHDDALAVDGDAADPSRRWLAAYEKESAAPRTSDPAPQAFGTFGANRNGLLDLSGNVWEWTSTCYVRHALHSGADETSVENCGVRVVEGGHRTYLSDFIRNPLGGACSVGVPPSNLGIRLVRDDDPGVIAPLLRIARRVGVVS
jgi:formylglycine-generating enzyme required for sulfatase activity